MFGCSLVLLCIGSSPGDDIYKEWEVVSAWGKKVDKVESEWVSDVKYYIIFDATNNNTCFHTSLFTFFSFNFHFIKTIQFNFGLYTQQKCIYTNCNPCLSSICYFSIREMHLLPIVNIYMEIPSFQSRLT